MHRQPQECNFALDQLNRQCYFYRVRHWLLCLLVTAVTGLVWEPSCYFRQLVCQLENLLQRQTHLHRSSAYSAHPSQDPTAMTEIWLWKRGPLRLRLMLSSRLALGLMFFSREGFGCHNCACVKLCGAFLQKTGVDHTLGDAANASWAIVKAQTSPWFAKINGAD